MKAILLVVTAAAALAAGLVFAQSGADVLKAKGCMNCHENDKKKVGPAYKDVAAKYKGDNAAPGMLVGKIKEGKTHPKVDATDAELKAAVGTVLSTK
jgi:cytochrome c